MTKSSGKTIAAAILAVCLAGGGFLHRSGHAEASAAAAKAETKPASLGSAPSGDELAGLEIRRRQLAEKEAALTAKEQELKKLAAKLEARLAEINAVKKSLDESVKAKRQEMDERYKRMLKIYKGLKPEEAGKLMDKLDEDTVIGMLNQMDQKTAIKLIPFLNQPRVVKWSRLNLTK
jgi:flagellar motility protein MotE (MotC chaperone)